MSHIDIYWRLSHPWGCSVHSQIPSPCTLSMAMDIGYDGCRGTPHQLTAGIWSWLRLEIGHQLQRWKQVFKQNHFNYRFIMNIHELYRCTNVSCLLIAGSQTWAPPTLDGSCQSMNPWGQKFKTDACPIPKLIPAMEHPLGTLCE